MIDLLIFLLTATGITCIITRSTLMRPLRELCFTGFQECPMCVGFWVGYLLRMATAPAGPLPIDLLVGIGYGCMASFTAFFLILITDFFNQPD